MFTGIIETTGIVLSIQKNTKQKVTSSNSLCEESNRYIRVRIGSSYIIQAGITKGDSLCVNGVCLTVVKKSSQIQRLAFLFAKEPQNAWVEIEMLASTLEKTSMRNLKVNDRVNLERATRASQRIGGHFVTGHIACVGTIEDLIEDGENCFLTVEIPEQYMKYMILEGSITLDGVSLTIATINDNSITCNIIPHTRAVTNLRDSKKGDKMNVEPDIIARYVENMVYDNAHKTAINNNIHMTCNVI